MVDCDGWACRQGTAGDDSANGAHNMQGSTDGWYCSDKWVWINSLVFCCFVLFVNSMVVFLCKYVPHMQLKLICTYKSYDLN